MDGSSFAQCVSNTKTHRSEISSAAIRLGMEAIKENRALLIYLDIL